MHSTSLKRSRWVLLALLLVSLVAALSMSRAVHSAEPPVAVYAKTFVISKVKGVVFARPAPGEPAVEILGPVELPYGAAIDARAGRVSITSANAAGALQTGEFWGGRFKVTQESATRPFTNLTLLDEAENCKVKSLAAAKKKRKGGKLWGNSKGDFRTTGAGGAASTRGTKWFTWEVCRGTYFRVTESTIDVRDFGTGKSVTLKTGEAYLART